MVQSTLDAALAAAMPRTLASINARLAGQEPRTWSQYTFVRTYAVGSQSRRWSGSPKTHLLKVDTIVAESGEHKPGTYKVGDRFSVSAPCNSNGQHTGTVYERADLADITCTKCLKVLEGLA